MRTKLVGTGFATLLALTACEQPQAQTQTQAPGQTQAPTQTQAPAQPQTPAPSAAPAIETACKSDAECDLYLDGSEADICCPKCTSYKGATKASLARLRAGCKQTCPISCAQPATHAACKAGACVAVRDN